MSKTVMPSSTRTIAPQSETTDMRSMPSAGGNGVHAMKEPAPAAARSVSFTPTGSGSRDLPPAIALALEPRMDRVISLQLSDLIAQIPSDLLTSLDQIDGTQRILLKAAEVEKGMANGRPTVSLVSIHQQVPQIFIRDVPSSDTTQVALPFSKVLDEFTNLQVRGDQVRQSAVPQVETPFLKVTLEDNERFGTTMEVLETGDIPPVRVEPATAHSFAQAEPEPISPATQNGATAAPQKSAPPRTRIPFSLSPNGTDAPAPESVPASDGSSVPTSLAPEPAAAPMRVPFRIVPPPVAEEQEQKAAEPWLTADSMNGVSDKPEVLEPVSPIATGGVKIRLSLQKILQTLPPFQLTGDPSSVAVDVRIELPFTVVEPQLASGRISITPAVFSAAIPQGFRGLFDSSSAADVLLPLQEVLTNLPSTSLRMRDDQVEQEVGANFATPFAAKAEEDAKRFNVSGTPVAKPAPVEIEAASEVQPEPEPEVHTEPSTTDTPLRNPLQVALDTDDKLDAKKVVAHVNRMAGIKATAIMFADGLSLAGSLPAEFETDALCAMAPALLQRIENNLVETKLGPLRGTTLACAKAAVTFFMHDNLCLAAMHSNGEISGEVREKLGRVVHELSRKYSHPV